ncbi:MAG: translation initiation factor IF-3 [Candidatus Cloacimonadota bacterium]|nr:translation initiation factor IF-3 [Candidatus Cloacimonadota bacterium]
MRRGKAKKKPEVPKDRINNQIKGVPKVRLIGADGKQIGVVRFREAINHAKIADLDLVEISPTAKPPVCKILDYGKYYYAKEQKLREARKKQHIVQVKELKYGPNTEEHDYDFKKKNAIKFLIQKNKVKFTVRFRGRQLAHKEIGYELLEKIKKDFSLIGDIDSQPTQEHRNISMIVKPKKNIEKILKELEEKDIEI